MSEKPKEDFMNKFEKTTLELVDKWKNCSFDSLIKDKKMLENQNSDKLESYISKLWIELAEFIFELRLKEIYNEVK